MPFWQLMRVYLDRIFGAIGSAQRTNSAHSGEGFTSAMHKCRSRSAVALVGVLLGVVAALEFHPLEIKPQHAIVSAADGATNGIIALDVQQSLSPPANGKTWASTALARPLFSPSRSFTQATARISAVTPTLPRLTGIILTSSEKLGIFSRTDGSLVLVREGSNLGQLKVLSIGENTVMLTGKCGVQSLHVAYDHNAEAEDTVATAFKINVTAFPGSNSWPAQIKSPSQ